MPEPWLIVELDCEPGELQGRINGLRVRTADGGKVLMLGQDYCVHCLRGVKT